MKPKDRLARALGLDGNPLRRRVDRAESAIAIGLAVLFLACAPLLAIWASQWSRQAGQDEQRAQRAWHQISAVTLEAAPLPPAQQLYALQWNDAQVLAQWTTPGGATRTGEILTMAGTQAGQSVRIWVTPAGELTGPPLSPDQLSLRVMVATGLTPAGLAAALLGLGCVVRWVLNRRRLAAWESDWARFEPRWTRHR
jgi:hypothetical protein